MDHHYKTPISFNLYELLEIAIGDGIRDNYRELDGDQGVRFAQLPVVIERAIGWMIREDDEIAGRVLANALARAVREAEGMLPDAADEGMQRILGADQAGSLSGARCLELLRPFREMFPTWVWNDLTDD